MVLGWLHIDHGTEQTRYASARASSIARKNCSPSWQWLSNVGQWNGRNGLGLMRWTDGRSLLDQEWWVALWQAALAGNTSGVLGKRVGSRPSQYGGTCYDM